MDEKNTGNLRNKKDIIDWENLSRDEERRLRIEFASIKYLNEIQWKAMDGLIPMTQEIFDSIMECRAEVGPEMNELAISVFIKFAEFGMVYADKLTEKYDLPEPEDIPEEIESPEEKEAAWIGLKKRIKEKYGDDLD